MNQVNQLQQEPMMNKFQKQFLIDIVDKLLLQRLHHMVGNELYWIREEYGDDKISEFLEGDVYYFESPLLESSTASCIFFIANAPGTDHLNNVEFVGLKLTLPFSEERPNNLALACLPSDPVPVASNMS